MPLSQREIQSRALDFAREWEGTTRERAEAQSFWNDFFSIFGINRRRVASFERPAIKSGGERGSIDLFWKGTLIVEHKSKGQNLDKAYEQALGYFPGIKDQDLPKYVLVSDFANFRLYDLEDDTEIGFILRDLPSKLHYFGFISGYSRKTYKDQASVNVDVAKKMGDLHDLLLESGYSGHKLEIFLVRLIYCLFADDTGIFPKDHFRYIVESRTSNDGHDVGTLIASIFDVLDTPSNERQQTLDEEIEMFPYVNGALFGETLRIPSFNTNMRNVLLECCSFDWSKVSPAIFGSMFQSVMDTETRRDLGAHYTSERNILKVVRGLFLDKLNRSFEAVKHDRRGLETLHTKISQMKFLDPACGCGNFLIITYRELRRLEIRIMKRLSELSGGEQLTYNVQLISKIDVDAMFGIEIEEFPARIAEVALWLTDHQMNMELSLEFGETFTRLPLTKSAHIVYGNALRINWFDVFVSKVPQSSQLYILGNPPFIGKKRRDASQGKDMELVFSGIQNSGILDFVCAWFIKASELATTTSIDIAFVSTNSITQGEQVGVLWKYLLSKGLKINFVHRTFKWSNEAPGVAQVFCVIIGFSANDTDTKMIYDYITPISEPMELKAKNINPYLVDGVNVLVFNRTTPICDVPEMQFGSMPNDDSNLILNDEEKNRLIAQDPKVEPFIKPLISAQQFLNGQKRWCFWLVDAPPNKIREISEIKKRVDAVKKYRLASTRQATVRLADYPSLFGEIRQPKGNYVLIPRHSSENRKYIPIAFFTQDHIASDSCLTLPNATLYHFGVLTSAMHMAWMRQVCGRIKSDYRYSIKLVYNNFPWPRPTESQIARIEVAVQEVLSIRAGFEGISLADLYDPSVMPKRLVDAHKNLDEAVEQCYRKQRFKTDLERLEYLFALYRQYTEPLIQMMDSEKKQLKRIK